MAIKRRKSIRGVGPFASLMGSAEPTTLENSLRSFSTCLPRFARPTSLTALANARLPFDLPSAPPTPCLRVLYPRAHPLPVAATAPLLASTLCTRALTNRALFAHSQRSAAARPTTITETTAIRRRLSRLRRWGPRFAPPSAPITGLALIHSQSFTTGYPPVSPPARE